MPSPALRKLGARSDIPGRPEGVGLFGALAGVWPGARHATVPVALVRYAGEKPVLEAEASSAARFACERLHLAGSGDRAALATLELSR